MFPKQVTDEGLEQRTHASDQVGIMCGLGILAEIMVPVVAATSLAPDSV